MTARITAAQAAELLRNATPGPWRMRMMESGRRLFPEIYAEHEWIASGREHSQQNAVLIAAAPALAARVVALESALREMLKWADEDHDKFTDACDLSRALLSPDDTRTTP